MTNDRDKHKMDELVSETYRALADEQTPEHLNESVLRMAADQRSNGRKGYSFIAWIRPAAWAATIGLSLAILLEVTQVTNMPVSELTTEKSSAPAAMPESESVRDQFVPQGDNVVAEAERIAKLRSGSSQSNDKVVDTPIPDKIEPRAHEPARSDLQHRAEKAAPSAVQPQEQVPAVMAPPVSGLVELRNTQMQVESAVVLERSHLQEKSDAINACKADARETAEAWFACIENLRELGKTVDADREIKALLLLHPDFVPPK